VVVRRRVYDAALLEKAADTPRAFTTATQPPSSESEEEEEGGPPSSINVARALASLRGDELQRVEELVRADEDEEGGEAAEEEAEQSGARAVSPPPPAAAAPTKPTMTLRKTIALSELANRMGVASQELPATLVARGFYALDAKTVLSRETARVIAEMYGWRVEDAPPELDEPPPVKSGTRSRIARKRKVGTKTKSKSKVKAKGSKPAKRRLAR
jgi:hypothetical protein